MSRHLLAAIWLLAGVTAGHAFCTKPNAPFCATRFGEFDDQDDFETCQRQMRSYKDQTQTFLECQRSDSQEAIDGYNDAVARFNRRARG